MRLRWTNEALRNLESIGDYIAQDNPQAAARVVNAVKIQAEKLAASPGMGRPGRIARTRELVLTQLPYVVVYQVTETIEILSIRHTSRAWPDDFDTV